MTQPPERYLGQPYVIRTERRRRRWPVVLLVLLLVLLLAGGCLAVLDGIGRGLDQAGREAQERTAPRDVREGKAFTIGKHETVAGWKVQEFNWFGTIEFTVEAKVRNVSTETSTAYIHFKFLTPSGEVLGNVRCGSGDLEPGQTQALTCDPDGRFGEYAKVTAEATF